MDRTSRKNGSWKGGDKKYLTVYRREEEEWEDLDQDGWNMLQRMYVRCRLKDGDRMQWTEKNWHL